MYEPVQIRYSRKKALRGLAVGVMLTLPLLTNAGRDRWYWVVYLSLMLLNSLYILKALFIRDIVLTIDNQGIRDHRLGNIYIPWERIDNVSLHHGERIFLSMSDTSHLGWEESRLSIFHKPITVISRDGVVIDTRGLEYDFEAIAKIVYDWMGSYAEKHAR